MMSILKTKRVIACLFTIIILAACNENTKKQEQLTSEPESETPVKKTPSAETVKNIPTNFGGIWVSKKYIDKLLATQSPKKSQNAVSTTMLILPNNLNQEATSILEFHEGTNGKVIKKNGVYEILSADNDGNPQTFQIENNKVKTQNDEFIKLKGSKDPSEYRVLEQILFAGNYEMDGKKVEFSSDGKVIGLENFTYYSVLIDYYDAGMQVDQLRLGKSIKDSKLYGFDFKKNKLTIYELKCLKTEGEYCQVVKNGKKLYTLLKK